MGILCRRMTDIVVTVGGHIMGVHTMVQPELEVRLEELRAEQPAGFRGDARARRIAQWPVGRHSSVGY